MIILQGTIPLLGKRDRTTPTNTQFGRRPNLINIKCAKKFSRARSEGNPGADPLNL